MKEAIQWVRCAGHQGYEARFAGIDFWWPGHPSNGYSTEAKNGKGAVKIQGEFTTLVEATEAAYQYALRHVRDTAQHVEDARQILALAGERGPRI